MRKEKHIWKSFTQFYMHFKIPWWLFVLSLGFGIVYAEIALKISANMIRVNKGELYNSVILGYVLLSVLNSILVMFQNVLNAYGVQKIVIRARLVLWNKILRLPLSEIERRQPSALVSSVVNEIPQASTTITMLFLFGSSAYGFSRASYTLYRANAGLTLYLLMLIPVIILVFFLIGRFEYSVLRKKYQALNEMTSFFSEHLSAAKHIKAQSMENREIQIGLDVINKKYRADIYGAFMSSLQILLNSIYSNLTTLVIAVGGSELIRQNKMESTGINTFSNYMDNVNKSLAEILTQYQGVKGTQGALRNVNVLLGQEEEKAIEKDFLHESGRKDIVFDQVTFGYDVQNPVLNQVSFTIPYGKITAIVGDNGSGKSTILKLMQGFYLPSKGKILVGENDVNETNLSSIRRQFGYVLQYNPLFSGTVAENILYGIKGEVPRESMIAVAKLADAHDFIMGLPNGYETDIGEGGGRLSGGQRQRIAIARVLMENPQYLLLDEAGASLDHQSDTYIYHSLRKYMKGRTMVVIAHDMQEIMSADQIIVLHNGKLEAVGTHEELKQNSSTYRSYVEKQMQEGGNP